MIDDLIRRARQRFVLNETLAQFAFAAAVFVAGFVLMLVFGTRYLQWWALAVFAAAGLAVGAWRVWQRTPDAYTTAVRLDQNAGLHDALSTALHFKSRIAGSPEFRESQHRQAEAAAAGVQLESAVPFIIPRAVYAMAALCVLASALVALRYGMGHGLNLRAPITQMFLEDQALQNTRKPKSAYPKSQNEWMKEAESLLSKLGMEPKPNEPVPGDPDALDKAIEQALQNPADTSAQQDGKSDKKNGSGTAGKDGQSKAGESAKDAPAGDPMDNGNQQQGEDQKGAQSASNKSGDQNSKSSSAGKNGSPNNKESLLSKLKDAVSNLLSKSDSKNSSPSEKNQQSAKAEQMSGAKGEVGKGAKQKGESQAEAQDGQPDNDGEAGQQAQGKLNSPANQSPSQGGSGIGSQDGSKEMKAAEQLKAMGKISEIIGQRAASVTGETTVEVQSGAQKLHTEYSKTSATHAETDGDVTRDEIPLALQAYVQQYFAEVRKTAPAKQKKQ